MVIDYDFKTNSFHEEDSSHCR